MENTDKTAETGRKKTPVKIIIEREFIGTKTVSEIFIPIIFEDIRGKIRTLDNEQNSA